jgi:hypothetical protein
MQKLNLLLVTVSFIVLSSCLMSQDHISGNGKVESREIAVEPFTDLSLHCKCNVEIVQSDKQLVIIEADENLHEYFEVTSKEGKLIVKNPDNTSFNSFKKINVQVHVNELTSLNLGIVGNLTFPDYIKSEKLDIRISSVGNSQLHLVADQITTNISAVGNTKISGSANQVKIKNSCVGNIDMKDFRAKVLDVNNSSVGNMHVYATDEISIHHSGVGNLTYSGGATVKTLNSSGIGSVKEK